MCISVLHCTTLLEGNRWISWLVTGPISWLETGPICCPASMSVACWHPHWLPGPKDSLGPQWTIESANLPQVWQLEPSLVWGWGATARPWGVHCQALTAPVAIAYAWGQGRFTPQSRYPWFPAGGYLWRKITILDIAMVAAIADSVCLEI